MRGSRDCRVAGGSCPTSGWSRTGWRSTCTRFRATSSTATRTPPGTRAESSSRRSLKDDRNHDENELKLGRAGPGLYDRINVFSDYPALYGSRMNELMGLLVHQLKTQNENIPQVYVDHILLSTGRSVGRLYVILQIYFLTTQVFFMTATYDVLLNMSIGLLHMHWW